MEGTETHSRPCCGTSTELEPHSFEICDVCWWQDDGQDDVDAHLEYGGPNKTTLWEARRNVLKFGASELRFENGDSLAYATLDACSEKYWDNFHNGQQRN